MKRLNLKAWQKLREEARHCQACPLYKNATQTVFGEGPVNARIVLIGEQPGDQEDRAGSPSSAPQARSSIARWPTLESTVRNATSRTQ